MRETGNFHTPLNIIFRKHTMTYSFDTELAQKLGVNEAILLQNIVFWLLKNKANGSNYYDGRYWTYNSHKAFKELFPFWTENQIRRILESLFEKGVILKGDYNSSPYDKTKWYALSDKYAYLIGLNSQSDMANLPDGDDEKAGCLIGTDSKLTDIKPDSKQQIVNTDMQNTLHKGSFSFSLSKDTQKEQLPYKEIIDYLNLKLGSKYKHDSQETRKHIRARFNQGFTLDDFYTVIDKKVLLWGKDIKMQAYLRPETLFGTKFESYLNEVVSQGKILQAQGVLSDAGAKTMEVAQEWIND